MQRTCYDLGMQRERWHALLCRVFFAKSPICGIRLPCFPVAQTLPRRDETQLPRKVRAQSVMDLYKNDTSLWVLHLHSLFCFTVAYPFWSCHEGEMTRPAVQSLLCAESNLWHQGCLAFQSQRLCQGVMRNNFLKKYERRVSRFWLECGWAGSTSSAYDGESGAIAAKKFGQPHKQWGVTDTLMSLIVTGVINVHRSSISQAFALKITRPALELDCVITRLNFQKSFQQMLLVKHRVTTTVWNRHDTLQTLMCGARESVRDIKTSGYEGLVSVTWPPTRDVLM